MKNFRGKGIFTKGGILIGAVAFTIYGIILLSLDQRWVLWAGSMSFGALYVPDPPPPLFFHSEEAFQMSALFNLFGLLALLLLMVVGGEVTFGWLSWLRAWWKAGALGTREQQRGLKVKPDASLQDVHLRW